MIVTMEHLNKFLKKKIDRKDYGSVLIHFKKGEITGITEKNDYNCAAFIDTATKSVNTVIVRSYKKKPVEESIEKLADLPENGEKVVNLTKNTSQTGSKLAGNEDDK